MNESPDCDLAFPRRSPQPGRHVLCERRSRQTGGRLWPPGAEAPSSPRLCNGPHFEVPGGDPRQPSGSRVAPSDRAGTTDRFRSQPASRSRAAFIAGRSYRPRTGRQASTPTSSMSDRRCCAHRSRVSSHRQMGAGTPRRVAHELPFCSYPSDRETAFDASLSTKASLVAFRASKPAKPRCRMALRISRPMPRPRNCGPSHENVMTELNAGKSTAIRS